MTGMRKRIRRNALFITSSLYLYAGSLRIT